MYKLKKYIAIILSLSLVVASLPAHAFGRSSLAAPGESEIASLIIKHELIKRGSDKVTEQKIKQTEHDGQKKPIKKKILFGLVKGSGFALLHVTFESLGIVMGKYIFEGFSQEKIPVRSQIHLSCRYMFNLAFYSSIWLLLYHIAKYVKMRIKNKRSESVWDALLPEINLLRSLNRDDRVLLFTGALCAHVLCSITYYFGLILLSSKTTMFAFQTSLLFSFYFGRKILNEKVFTFNKITGSLMVLSGVIPFILFFSGSENSPIYEATGLLKGVGVFVVFICAGIYACKNVIHKIFFTRQPDLRGKTLKFNYGLAFLVLFLPASWPFIFSGASFPLIINGWIMLAALIFPIGHFFLYTAQRTKGYGVTHLAPVMSLGIIAVTVFEGIIFSHWPKDLQIFALLAVLAIMGNFIASRDNVSDSSDDHSAHKVKSPYIGERAEISRAH